MKRLMVAAAGLLLAAPLWAQFGGEPTVEVAVAEQREMAPTMQVSGTVLSRADASLSAEVEGRLVEVADVGTRAAEGDVIARIEDTVLSLRLSELEAEISRGEARLKFLDAELARVERLAETNLAAESQIDQTRSERDMAQSDLAVTRSRLAQLKDQIERSRVRAPFSGVVVERVARAGERVGVGARILRLVDPDSLEVVARAPLRYYRYVQPGDELAIDAEDEVFEAPLRTVVSVGNEDLHVFELRLDIEQPLPVGQTVRVTIPTAELREVLAVPRDALVLRGSGTAVFVIEDDGTARRATVSTGIGQGDWIEVAGPVQAGDRVVIRGNERLRDGQTVEIANG
ncbi:efflux RND transporter periplasmic adaptor subunit [Wenzhouxiangella sp. XN201]|uniref:efflux RND transporter periplasmic adaptor subunit n=1 Tax=Wenzhouxiangella sp. XN201 TaxID=2710755 RepID=UPI0013C99AE2|nr:efflux RND transporter periplasmic adaptor subunit [Wenzhouxiangella sp. XN201]NEZ04427.1 efflux RND transporter periplasmic adaptor subunit [Wenzhouxiangella sp. XN201]